MLIIRSDSDGTRNAIATGRLVGTYKTYKNKNGILLTEFTMCVNSQVKENKYQTVKVTAFGEASAKIVSYSKQNKETLIAFGNCSIDKEMTSVKGETQYALFANALISPLMIFETYEHHLSSLQLDKILSANCEENLRYDYTEEPNPDDHRI